MKRYYSTYGVSVFLLALIVTFFTNCSRTDTSGTPMKLGFVGPLTGPAASYGIPQKNGIELAVEEINVAGGVNGRKVEVVFEDSQMDPNKSVSATKKLIDIDKVIAVIGDTSTSATMAIADSANRSKTVLLSPLASGAVITGAGDYVFRISPADTFQANIAAKVASGLGFKKGAVIYTNDDWGGGIGKAFQEDFIGLGGKIVASEGCNPGTQDFRTQLVKVKAMKPEFIYIPLHPAESAIFLRQVKEVRVGGQIIGADNFSEKAILKTAGNAAEGVIFAMPAPPSGATYDLFAKKYKERFKEDASYTSAAAYDAAQVLVNVVRKAGTSGEKVKDGLYELKDYKGVSGVIGFDKNGDVTTKEFSVLQIRNGDYIPFKKS